MKRKLMACTALVLCLALLCGCTSIATSEWMQDLFPVGDEAVAAQQTGSVEDSTAEQEVKQVVTETYTELDAFGLAYQPDYGLQPYNCQSLNNRIIFSFLYEPLFAVTDGYEAEPILAESYLVTDDGKTTTVKLRSGVTFHDGTAMTAADAAYSIASAMGSEYYGSRLRFIIEAQAQDDLTLVLTTSEAYECLPLLLDIPIIKAGTKDDASPMGTGPYEFADTKLVRCQNWWLSSTSLSSSPLTTSGSSLLVSCQASIRSLSSCRTCCTTASEHSSSSALRSTPPKVSRCSSAGIGGWTWNSASMSG